MKNKTFARIAAALLSLLLVLTFFASCANVDTPDTTPTAAPTSSGDNTPTPTEAPRIDHGVNQTFDDTVNVLHWIIGGDPGTEKSWLPWEEIAVEDNRSGDLLVDDVYDRNAWIEENYGITITNTYQEHNTHQNTMVNMLKSGDDDFQLYVTTGYGLNSGGANFIGNHSFLDLTHLDGLDLSHPWWTQNSIRDFSIGLACEFCVSDMLLVDKGATTCVFFNKTMANDLGITKIYDDVRNKEWTIEKLAEYGTLATIEKDGNDTMDGNDQWGVSGGDDPVLSFYLSSGNHFIAHGDDGYFYYQFGEESTLNVMADILNIVMYGDYFFNSWLRKSDAVKPSFNDGDTLFNPGLVKNCIALRNSEVEYGIIPNPIADLSSQTEYGSWVHSYHGSMMGIPYTCGNQDTVAAALELLGYYTYYEIYSDLYDTVICDRGTRDDESVEMLKIIFGNRLYDFGVVSDVQNFTDNVLRFTSTGRTNIQTLIDSKRAILDNHIDTLNDLIDNY